MKVNCQCLSQAYRNEALIWRNKAAQLELVVRDHLMKTSGQVKLVFFSSQPFAQEQSLMTELETARTECELLRRTVSENGKE